MINVLVLFPISADPKVLDDFLSNTAIPFLKQARGLRSLKISSGDLMSGGPPPYSKVVEASFDSLDDWMALGESPGVQVLVDYIQSAGALMLGYEVNEQ